MPHLNPSQRTLTCKIVYCGPGMSGKTTNLEQVYESTPEERRGELTSIATRGDRTIFYDYLPLEVGSIAGVSTRLQLYTVPGQPYYAATRRLVLVGVDGIVFVADSQPKRLEENVAAFEELTASLREQGKDLALLPLVFQWNKRDLPGALPAANLERALNPHAAPSFESVANRGEGVLPTLRRIARQVIRDAESHFGGQALSLPKMRRAPIPKAPPPAPPPAQPKGATSPLELERDTQPFGVRIPLPDSALASADADTIDAPPGAPMDGDTNDDVDPDAPERNIGQVVGGCVILAKLGEGGMGSVYLARHQSLGKDFVIKTLKPKRTKNPVSVKRFFAEARAIARLQHENVVRVEDAGTTDQGMHYMVMQYVDGMNLEDQIKETGRPLPTESARIVLEVARALEASHEAGVIHRDVKPQNIVIDRDGGVTLIDFGLARDVAEAERLTRPGGIVGTPAYMAPEMVEPQGHIDGRVDLFALGLTFYYLLTGQTPFLGSDVHDLFMGRARLTAPEAFAPDLPRGYRVVLERMLARERDARYDAAGALIKDLELLQRGGQPTGGVGDSFWLWRKGSSAAPLASGTTLGHTTADTSDRPKTVDDAGARAPADNPLVKQIEEASRNPGNRLEECVLLSVLDQTPFATLHKAWDLRGQRLVAVRVLTGFGGVSVADSGTLAAAKRVEIPGIPRLQRYGVTDEGELYLVTSMVRGRTLSSYRFKPKRVVMAIRDVARALDSLGRRGILHRNLQPASVLIDDAAQGHVLDLGLGSVIDEHISPRYRAPEHLRGAPDARSEVYALGATFYFGLARQPPGTGDLIPPRKLRGGIPQAIQDMCLRCLENSPSDRYPTLGAFADDLDAFLKKGPSGRKSGRLRT